MKHVSGAAFRIVLFVLILLVCWWASVVRLSSSVNLMLIVGGLLLVFPFVWFGRKLLDQNPTPSRVAWVTTLVHYGMLLLLGVPIVRALTTHEDWTGWVIPIPALIGRVLAILTGAACMLTVANLALRGWGAPFAIALSRRLAVDWLYAWTRNPMVLATLACLISVGIWFRSGLFVLWALMLFSPALLFFVKVYEERELELRFGARYLEYKARTPMLFPRRPRG